MNGEENNNNVENQEQVTPEISAAPQVVSQPAQTGADGAVIAPQVASQDTNVSSVEQQAQVTQVATEVSTEAPKQDVVPKVSKTKKEKDTQPHNPKVNDQVISVMPKEKDGSILGILFFFGLILAFVYYLPNVNKYLAVFIPSLDPENRIIKPRPPVVEEEAEKKEELTFYHIDGMISDAKIDELSLGNFVKDNNDGVEKIKFYLLNNGENVFTFNDKTKFFLDFYENNSYLSSVLVFSFDSLASKESKDFTINISKNLYAKANMFTITRKKTVDYPTITLNKVEGDYKILNCTYGNDSINYYFIDNYLEVIDETYTESNSVVTYANDLQEYSNIASKYQGISAISYDIIESGSNFVAKTNIKLKDINDVDLTKLATYKFFPYHRESSVVAYEMSALGYTCS